MTLVALLDVNVLVALFDPDHVHHEAAHDWFAGNREAGWATKVDGWRRSIEPST